MIFGGVAIELLFYKYFLKTYFKQRSTVYRFLYLLTAPIIATFYLYKAIGWIVIIAYILFSIGGFILEWLMGYTYHKLMGRRLWTYGETSVTGYSSILSIPLWGFLGLLFWLAAKSLLIF